MASGHNYIGHIRTKKLTSNYDWNDNTTVLYCCHWLCMLLFNSSKWVSACFNNNSHNYVLVPYVSLHDCGTAATGVQH